MCLFGLEKIEGRYDICLEIPQTISAKRKVINTSL